MLTHSTRRWLAGLGVAGALVAASAIPASAAPTGSLKLSANDVIVAPGGATKWVTLSALGIEWSDDIVVKVDRSEVAGFADVRSTAPAGVCTEAGVILTCRVPDLGDGDPPVQVELSVRAKDGARPDQEGELAFTVTAPGSGSGSFRSTVAVGEGVDLAAAYSLKLTGAPGGTLKAPLTLENRGETAARGAVLFVSAGYGLRPSQRYENCRYASGAFGANPFVCTFDTVIAPHEAAALDSSFGFTVPADSWAPAAYSGSAFWFTPADWKEYKAHTNVDDDLGPGGTDGKLELRPVTTRRSAQTDVDPYDNQTWIELQVTGDQRADVAALGAKVDARVGRTVPVTFGYVNHGPAAVGIGSRPDVMVSTTVTLPKGVTAVRAPKTCVSNASGEGEPGEPGASAYRCSLTGRVGKGEKVEFAFTLRIDKAGSHTGEVRLHISDENPTNDTARILVNATGGQGGGNDDGDGGTLPITGGSTGLIAGVGGLLLVAGVGGYVLTRRRRTRFVA
ncbi:LPXTG cell wall anchor domain-containing protein [Micromonospora sp. DSM 115977]|uniref:LPXTG cell wall anchor domain-containing protein n=1 Tax=Micromonospora reichwaldensis TaxID=3075516 RepID=A0ABU2X702_9ACTN|nr:LPXTG cell wall anchor domain-containing protein [Micromonospora sp. DSM 115977]MDT0533209.1 LPXTG cell wall anchor domain-containing protein [Micromonospora sp. DSM 115977]